MCTAHGTLSSVVVDLGFAKLSTQQAGLQ